MDLQISKVIQNPSYVELQKSANQGRRCTWEKLSAMRANCGIELALDECVAVLNHMRRLKRSAERAAAAVASPRLARFSASKRIPSWNVIARENSTGSLEEDLMADHATRNWHTLRCSHDGSDSESDSSDLVQSWTRSGGPLMRTTSADKFVDYVQSLEVNSRTNPTSDDERVPPSASAIVVAEGDLLQPERVDNGSIVFNVVKRSAVTLSPPTRSLDSEHNSASPQESPVAELLQHDEMDEGSSISGDDDCIDGENVL